MLDNANGQWSMVNGQWSMAKVNNDQDLFLDLRQVSQLFHIGAL
jgi:hypothetical protein